MVRDGQERAVMYQVVKARSEKRPWPVDGMEKKAVRDHGRPVFNMEETVG